MSGMSAQEVEVLQKTMGSVFAPGVKDKNGDELVLLIFEKYPDSIDYFKDFKGKKVGDVRGDANLRPVSSRIAERLCEFVQNAGDMGKLGPMVQSFVTNHIGYGLTHKNFENVRTMFGAYLQNALKGNVPAGADAAAAKLFTVIIDAFKQAGK